LRLIAYQFVPSIAGKTFQLINPATEEPTYTVHEAGKEDIDLAVKYAKEAQPKWEALNSILPSSIHTPHGVANVHL
jgi:acyl-CoA reductase-like NAD-dependent aldehyde dehydrogenase